MKTVAVFGSPRKNGNSDTLAEVFLQEVENLGTVVTRFYLRELTYSGCIACNACKIKATRCVLDDDLSMVLDAVQDADNLVLATPVYFYDMPSQIKAFIDRWYSFFKPNYFARKDVSRLQAGKTAIIVVAQRATEAFFLDFIQRYAYMLNRFGFLDVHVIRGCELGDSMDGVPNRKDLIEKAKSTAIRVMDREKSEIRIPKYCDLTSL